MAKPNTADELLELLRKSEMVPQPKLDRYLAYLETQKPFSDDPADLAQRLIADGVITRFHAEQLMTGKFRGFTLGKYRILERIGIGGMGQVFLCEHLTMRRRVAIKVLPTVKAEDPAALGRFHREARASAALNHPNIVRAFDVDQDDKIHYLIMEFVDGVSLFDMVRRGGPISWQRSVHYIRESAIGLHEAYLAGLVHRDLKPSNIMVDRKGIVRILDMGLARFYEDTNDMLTQQYDNNSVLGTVDYVAPEQIVDSHNADTRADIYGLGATWYFILAGHPPFPEMSVPQKLIAHQKKQPTPIRQLRPDLPAELAAILERCLAKKPEDRFATPQALAEALKAWVPESIAPPGAKEIPELSPLARSETNGMPAPVFADHPHAEPTGKKSLLDRMGEPRGMPGGVGSSNATRPGSSVRRVEPVVAPPSNPRAPVEAPRPEPAAPAGHPWNAWPEPAPAAPPQRGASSWRVVFAGLLGILMGIGLWWLLQRAGLFVPGR